MSSSTSTACHLTRDALTLRAQPLDTHLSRIRNHVTRSCLLSLCLYCPFLLRFLIYFCFAYDICYFGALYLCVSSVQRIRYQAGKSPTLRIYDETFLGSWKIPLMYPSFFFFFFLSCHLQHFVYSYFLWDSFSIGVGTKRVQTIHTRDVCTL